MRFSTIDGRREVWLITGFLSLFFVFNTVTATAYPFPNIDECMIAEPAINLIHGKGFEVRFSEILAMYSFLLVPWIKLFGASLRSIRSANIACVTLAFWMLWSAVRKMGVIPQARWRLLLLCLLSTEFGVVFAYRVGRYDGFGCLLIVIVFSAMSIQTKRTRLLVLFTVCLFLPWAGPQYVVALFAAGVALYILFRLRFGMEIVLSFLAVGFGAIAFLSLVYLDGRLGSYREFLSIQQRGSLYLIELFKHGTLIHHNFLPKDFSLPFLILAGLIAFVSLRTKQRTIQYQSISFCLLYSIVLSSLLLSLAKFPTYYSYLIAIPIAIAVISSLSGGELGNARVAVSALCLISVLIGAGMNVVAYASDASDHDYRTIDGFVARSMHGTDVAYVDPEIYLAARRVAKDVYFPNPDLEIIPKMSQEQKDSITLLVIQPSWISDATRMLGGRWQETGDELHANGHSAFGIDRAGFISWALKDLRVLRRSPELAPQTSAGGSGSVQTN